MRMFPNRQLETAPMGIVVKRGLTAHIHVSSVKLKGAWWRVFPSNQKEWLALTMLEHGREKFAPDCPKSSVNGNGALVSHEALQKIDY